MNTRIAVVLTCVLLATAPALAEEDDGRFVVRDVTIISGTETDDWPISVLMPNGTILLDTTTGKTWLLRRLPEGGVQWLAVPRQTELPIDPDEVTVTVPGLDKMKLKKQ